LQWHFGLVPSCSPSCHEGWQEGEQVYIIMASAAMPGFRATAQTYIYLALIGMKSPQTRYPDSSGRTCNAKQDER